MAALVTDMSDAVIAAYDFSRFKVVVDVGGGSGGLMAAMLRAHPALRGIVFDAIAKADALVPFGSRASAVRGSFFEAIPPGADCYVLSRVLHDWEDEDAVRILRSVAAAMPDAGTLVVIDRVLADDAADAEASISDLNMMVMNGGRERSGAEFRRLLEQAGLRTSRIVGTGCFASVIEAHSAKTG
jgi:hypothetical protein